MKLTRDIGIDLGTANVLVYEEGRGIVLREPSVVAVDKNTGKVLQVGAAARNMLGRTPGNVVAVRPLRDGVISDYEMTEKMLEQFLKKISKFSLIKPRVIVSRAERRDRGGGARRHSGDDGGRGPARVPDRRAVRRSARREAGHRRAVGPHGRRHRRRHDRHRGPQHERHRRILVHQDRGRHV